MGNQADRIVINGATWEVQSCAAWEGELDFVELIAELATGTYFVWREADGGFSSAGLPQAGAVSTVQIVAAIVPASGRDLLRLPEGRRSTATKTIYTTTQLLVGAEAGVTTEAPAAAGAGAYVALAQALG